jgi:succinyl-CoA synthetase beta subunit
MRGLDHETEREQRARSHGITYVELNGTIGCLVNGAGLAMATMDSVQRMGGAPANFLDIGGGATRATVAAAIGIILSVPQVRVVLVNVLGGITRCDEVALGIVAALRKAERRLPFVIRLRGTNEAEGRRLLEDSGIEMEAADSLAEAADKAVGASRALAGE